MDDRADGDRVVAIFIGNDERHFRDPADAHDRRVRLIDDRQAEDGPELAGVGDGERRALDVFGFESLVASALAEIGDAALQAEKVEIAGVFQDGHDQSPIEGDGNANVDVAVITNVLAFDAGVDDGPLLQSHDGGPDKERHEGEAGAMTLRVKSTSYMQWTCALVRRDSIMCLAISLRMFDMGTRSPG